MKIGILVLLIFHSTILLSQDDRKTLCTNRLEKWGVQFKFKTDSLGMDSLNIPFNEIIIRLGETKNKQGHLMLLGKSLHTMFGISEADYKFKIKRRYFKVTIEYPKYYSGYSPEYIYGYFESEKEPYLYLSDEDLQLKSKYLNQVKWLKFEN